MLKGQMMDRPLLVSTLIDYAAEVHATTRLTSAAVEGGIHAQTFAETRRRVVRLANVLMKLGVKPGDRVATLAWNTQPAFRALFRHLRASVRSATPSIRGSFPSR